ncbi:MAG: LLM class F420-dependent oxidoreductase [Micrococcales bacterium]|nr:LLM class F420-dependent oxidoreductase [Micrococcales bacterium]
MRFGMFIPQGWRLDLVGIDPSQQWDAMVSLARHADGGNVFESIWVYDHFHTVPEPLQEATHEAWTLMSGFAASTSRVRLGQMCTCVGYRNPAYLAKVAATVDIISGGRVEMGIGAGWYEHEWRAYGYGFPQAGERLGMLREGVSIMPDLWTTGTATLAGTYYQVDGAHCAPRPLQGTSSLGSQRSGIPLWVAGGGEKVTLRIAAEYADYTNFLEDADTFSHKSEVLRSHCRDVGRDFDSIVRSGDVNVVIGETEEDVEDRLAFYGDLLRKGGVEQARAERAVSGLRAQPTVGTPEQIIEVLQDLERRGLTYVIAYFAEAAHDRSGIELFERLVAPELR